MNKLGTALGGLLLIGALAAPVAFAHYDTGADGPLAGSFNNANPFTTANADRVAGWYYTSTNLDFDANGPAVDNPLNVLQPCPADDPQTPVREDNVCLLATSDISPDTLDFSTWGGLYDVEVGGLGTCDGSPLDATNSQNEDRVDGNPGLGLVPDGTHGDGGNSAVGHTFGHYDCNGGVGDASNWETAECDDYNLASAEDLVGGGGVWIGAQCNWGVPITSGNSAPLADRVSQFAGDVINCPLGGFPDSCTDALQYADDCIGIDLISQTQLPSATPNCGGTSSTSLVCGAGTESTIDFGFGDGSLTTGAVYPNAGFDAAGVLVLANCDELSTASAFPFTQVVITVDGGSSTVNRLVPATVGWVA